MLSLATILLLALQIEPVPGPDFAREIRPILSNACFKCHGPDEKTRGGKLRLDDRAAALRQGAIVPGKPQASELIARIHSRDPEEAMPPPAEVKQLTPTQKDLLRRWIAAGAAYSPHWAFVPPKDAPPPPVKNAAWLRTPVDAFVLARLEAAGLAPRPEADRAVLARRVALDLVGLPPSPGEVAAFLGDHAPDAYERYVDRLLATPHFGERWARRWLDLARYADTNGYEKDRPRVMWPWRDWVIRAYNEDLPFDRFTIEQLAGDMLPGAGVAERVATGFHRNTMINEEGGIDPLEFRFHAQADRVATTGTVWLGLTLLCAQCHTHKYDPIPHADYYRLMAFLDGADELEMPVPDPDVTRRREEQLRKIADAEAALPSRFPAGGDLEWAVVKPSAAEAKPAAAELLEDGSIRIGGESPEKAVYEVRFEADLDGAAALRLEVLADESLPRRGPGRSENGNFVLGEISVRRDGKPVTFAWAEADYEQEGWPVRAAYDGKADSGWAVDAPKGANVDRRAVFHFEKPLPGGKASWTVKLDQPYGKRHTIGRLRLSLGRGSSDGGLEARRAAHLESRLAAWTAAESARAVDWSVLKPVAMTSNLPLLRPEADGSVFVHGDMSKRDLYELAFDARGRRITALRLEALADERLPKGGPGRVHYEGPAGDFWLSEITVAADGKAARIGAASHGFASGDKGASRAVDGDPQTGWSISGGQGRSHAAVFRFDPPLQGVKRLEVGLLFERYYAAGLGRFRISVTGEDRPAEARGHDAGVEAALRREAERRPPGEHELLRRRFLEVAPELEGARKEIENLRKAMPAHPTTLVFQEREPAHRRTTLRRHRGEYLQPKEAVQAEVLSVFPPLPPGVPRDRLAFARWLVNGEHPLTGRVVINRLWGTIFGRALVRTTEDFGLQGELPTHPELLDWLAREFVRQGWSWKRMLRLLTTSAAYRQDADLTPEASERDPENLLLSRFPRLRLDAELIRDAALKATGLLSPKIGGPSVFPPQPPGITTEGAYGPLTWRVSGGEDRYRRGLYTFAKRTAPYAMFATFDGPSGEACQARREVSNTPLQALTLLNDEVFIEASRHAGRSLAKEAGTDAEKIERIFVRCLTRRPTAAERARLSVFLEVQRGRVERKELDAGKLGGDPAAAAWGLLVRALLNLDEFVTRE
jgi:hypothetical protein